VSFKPVGVLLQFLEATVHVFIALLPLTIEAGDGGFEAS
jgi:hypothetical protein